MASANPVKLYFSKELAVLLSEKIMPHYPKFDKNTFVNTVAEKVETQELKARVATIAEGLRTHLPNDYNAAIEILLKILGEPLPGETGMFTEGYWLMPVAFFVEKYGLENYDTSIDAIYEITQRHTGEYAIRPYLENAPNKTLNIMEKWSMDSSFHVRRLASEGVRPRLPWAKKLQISIESPEKILPILENLKADESKYVQKSVANCINDILKDNYDFGLALLQKWSDSSAKETRWIVKHALRKLKKAEDANALAILEKIA